ncbi:MAG: hypothetical protein U1F25_02745 [Rubrivivax sp.]
MEAVGPFARLFAGFVLVLAAAAAAAAPAWMDERPKDDAQWWYGSGAGPDLESARRSALRSVAARLRSTIEGQVRQDRSVITSGGKERVSIDDRSSLVEDVVKTDFTRFEVVQSERDGQDTFALVRVDRPAFIADTRNQLQVIDKPVRAAEAALATQSTLEQFLALRRLKPQVENGLRLSLLLQGAGVDEEGHAGVRRFGGLLQAVSELASRLTFELRAAPADADAAATVAVYLTEQGMRSSPRPATGASPLTIQTESRQDLLFGSKMVKLKIRLSVLDAQGRAASTKEYEAPGSSRNDFNAAREDALKKFLDLLRKAGPAGALGFAE